MLLRTFCALGGRDHDHRPIIECQARVLDEKVISDESMKGGLYYLMTVPEYGVFVKMMA